VSPCGTRSRWGTSASLRALSRAHERERVAVREPLRVRRDGHARVERAHGARERRRLGRPHARLGVRDLPVQVALGHDVVVDDAPTFPQTHRDTPVRPETSTS
jgi:hypothetical protein